MLKQRHQAHHLCIVAVLLEGEIDCSPFPAISILEDRVKMGEDLLPLELFALVGEEKLNVSLLPQRKVFKVKSRQVTKPLQFLRPGQHSLDLLLGFPVVESIETP